jgi:hypothetical protein
MAGIIAGGGDSTGQFSAGLLEATHVIALPALQADGDLFQANKRLMCVHANSSIAFFCKRIRFQDDRI